MEKSLFNIDNFKHAFYKFCRFRNKEDRKVVEGLEGGMGSEDEGGSHA